MTKHRKARAFQHRNAFRPRLEGRLMSQSSGAAFVSGAGPRLSVSRVPKSPADRIAKQMPKMNYQSM